MMSDIKPLFYEFGEFRVDTERRLLFRNSDQISLTPKVFDTLLVFIQNRGEVLSKDRLMQEIWSDSFVEESNIAQNVAVLRKALGEKSKENRFIVTIPGRGYRFVAEVTGGSEMLLGAETAVPDSGRVTQSASIREFPHIVPRVKTHSGNTSLALAAAPEQERAPVADDSDVDLRLILEPAVTRSRWALSYAVIAAALFASILIAGALIYRYSAAARPSAQPRLAVLPLKPIDKTHRDELYEVGIADSLIQRLSRIKGFVVRPLTTVRKYDDIAPDPLAVGKEQQVDYVLISNYQLSDGKIRVTCELFNVATGEIQQTYKSEKDANDIFAMEDAVANEVGNYLQTQFAAVSTDPAAVDRGTTSEEAYRLYLQATFLLEKENLADQERAMQLLDDAVKIDPNYARAWAAYARAHCAYAHFGGNSPAVEFAIAEPYLERAFTLDKDLAEAHAVLGIIQSDYHWNFVEGEKHFLRAIEIAPNSDNYHRWYGNRLAQYGRGDEAIVQLKMAIDLNPNSVFHHLHYGRALYAARRYDDAIKQLQRVVEMDPTKPWVYGSLWLCFHMKGDYAQAHDSFIKYQRLSGKKDDVVKNYETLYEQNGWQGVLHAYLENIKAENENGSAAYFIAMLSALTGERDQAFQYLDLAVQRHLLDVAGLKGSPELDSLRNDPRFESLLVRTGMANKS
jgi:DNA-binding winged helix-turn-helix (wHTH) protein/TolB-like protein/Flp pilus assembly protein TadD